MLEGPKIIENLYFAVSCIAIFTSTTRSDYNFAIGLLCYYLIKNAYDKNGAVNKMKQCTKTVSTIQLILSDHDSNCTFNCYGHFLGYHIEEH